VLRKFRRNDDFAHATMKEVFGEESIATAEIHQADNFSSGAFLSQPDGTYRFEPFPPVAQISPMQGIVATDLDGDGKPDICAVNNTDVAIPRFDGGVGIFLKGNGDGTFEALGPAQSGVLVEGNAKALVVIDPTEDAHPDLFLTRHGGESEFLANENVTTRWLGVRLRGINANPDAVGARLRLIFSDGAVTHHEIGLGGGWLTQSTPCLFAAVPNNGRLVEAIVTWPDGRVSHHTDAPEQGSWRIRQPNE
jgi:hypothetical protein